MDRVIISDKLTPYDVYSAWSAYSVRTLGFVVPINIIEGEAHATVVGHLVSDTSPPMQCANGAIIRKLTLAFEFPPDLLSWS